MRAICLIQPELFLAVVADGGIPFKGGRKRDAGVGCNRLARVTVNNDVPTVAVCWLAHVRVRWRLRSGLSSGRMGLLGGGLCRRHTPGAVISRAGLEHACRICDIFSERVSCDEAVEIGFESGRCDLAVAGAVVERITRELELIADEIDSAVFTSADGQWGFCWSWIQGYSGVG